MNWVFDASNPARRLWWEIDTMERLFDIKRFEKIKEIEGVAKNA